eukprot:TRINITY_DN2052_c0_g1_i9.p1 TRINITY_DN2052_c0_g1~~TRINITY_DN2052_c0_g1_i9.p1  ORF type:complete len:1533 (-),score=241.28 TRINITY_DN2052_c0_g1_i9:1176-5774(-)
MLEHRFMGNILQGERTSVLGSCTSQIIAIALHLTFLSSFFITFIWRRITRCFPTNHDSADIQDKEEASRGIVKDTDDYRCNLNVQSNIIFKISLTCCFLLSSSYLALALHDLFWKGSRKCGVRASYIAEDIVLFFAWAFMSALVFFSRKTSCTRLPILLRIWWISSFFQSSISAVYDVGFQIRRKTTSPYLFLDCFDVALCLILLCFAIKGKTGVFSHTPELQKPLLHSSDDKPRKNKKASTYEAANLFDRVTFSWLNPLFSVGIVKPLDLDDVPNIAQVDSAEEVYHSFEKRMNTLNQDGQSKVSITKAVIMFIWKKAAVNGTFAIINACASFVGPYMIKYFVNYLNSKDQRSPREGYLLACAFFGAKVIETVSQRQWIFGARQLGMRLRAALTAHIYRKGLHLSNKSRQSHTSGEIINYMSVDVQRIGDFAWYLNTIWMLPIQILLALLILYKDLGWAAFAAFVATFAVMAGNLPLTKKQKYFQSKIMESKDNRMKATSEILKNMKILKLQAWEVRYLQRLEELRSVEYSWLKKSVTLGAVCTFIFWGAPAYISAITFGVAAIMGIPLTAGGVLSALATFRILQEPIYNLPDLLSVLAQAKVSLDRVIAFLQEEELDADAVEKIPSQTTEIVIEIQNGEFKWDPVTAQPNLKDLNLQVKKGMKVAVCGTVGAGKSSLLCCLLGEIPKIHGIVKIGGTKAYVPQSPWIQTGSIRENILFGASLDVNKYERVLHACALNKDLELFPYGDQTEIGERGINMSGGQKQRIQLARAMYQDADIYLMDDPFSAVDAHTGTHLFQECLMGVLTDKTIIYVTHQIDFLPSADLILVIKDGRIIQAGQYEELLQIGTDFETLVMAHNDALQSIATAEDLSLQSLKSDESNASQQFHRAQINGKVDTLQLQNSGKGRCNGIQQESNVDSKFKESQLIQEEEREKGSIDKRVYWSYLTAVYGGILVPVILLSQSLFQVLQIGSNYWMTWACPSTEDAEPNVSLLLLILVYTGLSVVASLCVLVRALLVATVGLLTSQKLFLGMLHSIFRAPMSFFDMTPTGRILNRASTDQSVVDLEIALRLGWVAFSVIQILGTIAVMSQVAWQVFAIFIPVTAICIWYQQYYIPTARELARLVGIQRAPVLHHFSETLSGVATVRAFEQESRFIERNLSLIDDHSRPRFHNVAAIEWLCFRLNLLSNFVFAFCLIVVVSLPEGTIDPGFAGLAVTYGLNLNVLQATIIWNLCNAETKMISVERIIQYSGIPSEAPLAIEDSRPPLDWPCIGTICLHHLQVRYARHLPLVLKDLTCTFPGKKKIGVVGRTGSGKSTLIQALFRLVEPADGKILIDGLDICSIGLHDLRSKLSIIPQEPAMFEGTLRVNFDPLEEYSDLEIWQALDKCQLGDVVRMKEEKLSSAVLENGENWSVGQRQLVCLGRVLLKKSKILVLDEATASVDTATDGVIQRTIRSEFADCTVITIAHRIHSVVDSDLVLLLGEGRILEYDSPSNLLENKNSSFSKLIKEYSMRSTNISHDGYQFSKVNDG